MRDVIFILPEIKGGGAEKSVINLCKSLEREVGYTTHLLTLSDKVEYDVDGIRLHSLNLTKKVSKKGLKRLTYRKKLASLVDDYILNNFSSNTPIFSNMIFVDKIMSKSKLNVCHIVRNSYSKPMLSGKNWLRKLIIKRNISSVYSNHPVVFVSSGAQLDFTQHFTLKTSHAVIHNAIDIEELQSLSDAYEVNGDYILHIGRFNRQKRHDILLDIYAQTKRRVNLRLMGKGELEHDIKSKVQGMGLDMSVNFEKFNENPYPIVKNSKLVVLTSDFEGLPRVLMEAVALGKPVISFDCPGGIREVLSNENSIVPHGNLEDFSSRIEDALDNPTAYINAIPEHITYRTVANKYKELIEGGFN